MRIKILGMLMILFLIYGCLDAGRNKNTFYVGMTYSEFRNTDSFKSARYLNSIIAEPELVHEGTDNEMVKYDSMYFDAKDVFGNDAAVDVFFKEDTRTADPNTNKINSSVITIYSRDNSFLRRVKEKYVDLFITKYNGTVKKEYGRDILVFYYDNTKMESFIDIKENILIRISIGYR